VARQGKARQGFYYINRGLRTKAAPRHSSFKPKPKAPRKPAGRVYDTARWKKIRVRVLLRDNYTCTACGVIVGNKPMNAHIHHIDGNPKNMNMENLATLCHSCHSSETMKGQHK